MPLTCSCSTDDYYWYYKSPTDYSKYSFVLGTCSSCGEHIKEGDLCTQFIIYEFDEETESEVYLNPMYHCEKCADMWFNFEELGFECIAPDENVMELLEQYVAGDYGDWGEPW
jgi:hypothetical protein